MIIVEVDYQEVVDVVADAQLAFALVSDIYRSGIHFAGVALLESIDDRGRWRWELEERGFGPIKLRACYEAIYRSDPERLRVEWNPPERGAGDMESSGHWQVESLSGGGCRLDFFARTRAHVPAPVLMQRMVDSIARQELRSLKAAYVAAIKRTLDEM